MAHRGKISRWLKEHEKLHAAAVRAWREVIKQEEAWAKAVKRVPNRHNTNQHLKTNVLYCTELEDIDTDTTHAGK